MKKVFTIAFFAFALFVSMSDKANAQNIPQPLVNPDTFPCGVFDTYYSTWAVFRNRFNVVDCDTSTWFVDIYGNRSRMGGPGGGGGGTSDTVNIYTDNGSIPIGVFRSVFVDSTSGLTFYYTTDYEAITIYGGTNGSAAGGYTSIQSPDGNNFFKNQIGSAQIHNLANDILIRSDSTTTNKRVACTANPNTFVGNSLVTADWVDARSGGNVLEYVVELNTADSTTNSGLLVIGQQYIVKTGDLAPGDDFSNTGYTAEGVIWTATATTPIDWTHNTAVTWVDQSQPQATVLQNEIGNIVWTTQYEVLNPISGQPYTGIFGTLTGAFPDQTRVNVTCINSDGSSSAAMGFWDANNVFINNTATGFNYGTNPIWGHTYGFSRFKITIYP